MDKKENKTFLSGDIDTNACVGSNGLNDLRTYAKGFLESAEFTARCLLEQNFYDKRDIWVYPIIFNARHGVELMLKKILSDISKIRPNVTVNLDYLGSHDIGLLWKELESKTCQIDRRYKIVVEKLNEHINDYADIDPTGQTFRYPDDKYKTQHLEETPLINLLVFYKRFRELKDNLDEFYWLTRRLREEYSLGTFTSHLSRNDIEEISLKLPKRDEWKNETFSNVRSKIISEYELSSNEFSRALKIIEKHPTFSSNIGIEIPLKSAQKQHLQLVFQELEKCHPRREQNSDVAEIHIHDSENVDFEEIVEYELQMRKSIVVVKEIPKTSLAEIGALFYLGRDLKYCERYEARMIAELNELNNLERHSDTDQYVRHYLCKFTLKKKVLHGLEIMGHRKLADSLR